MGANTIMPHIETDHPVLGAIAEFRESLNRLIDEQLSTLACRSNDFEVESYRSSVQEPTYASSIAPSSHSESVPQNSAELKPRRIPPMPAKPKPMPGDRPPEPVPEPVYSGNDDAGTSSDQRDPRQRLDALARLLDKRVKQSGTNPTLTAPRQSDK